MFITDIFKVVFMFCVVLYLSRQHYIFFSFIMDIVAWIMLFCGNLFSAISELSLCSTNAAVSSVVHDNCLVFH